MRRVKNLFQRLTSLENLYLAARRAARGKRFRPNVLAFNDRLEEELCRLKRELESGSYRPSPYRSFVVQEAKRRLISAAPFRDRVAHHALCNVVEPIFERTFVRDSYASRPGKGTHAALDRYTYFARRHRWVLQCDIEQYFPSIDHDILKAKARRKIGCRDTLRLMDLIIDTGPEVGAPPAWFPGDSLFSPLDRHRGLPIGNQTSQFFANVYLDAFDHFVKQVLRCPGYVRYVDDFVLFGDDPIKLADIRARVRERLTEDRLRLHPHKQQIRRVAEGVRFLGFRVFPDHRLLGRESIVRFRRRLRQLQKAWRAGRADPAGLRQAVAGWLGHARHGDTWGLQRAIFSRVTFP